MNLIVINYSIDIGLRELFNKRAALIFTLFFVSQVAVAQSSVVDSIWQSMPTSGTPSLVERFFLDIQKIQKQLKNSDITYAVTIGMNNAHNEQNAKYLSACYELAGDLYDANPSMQLNALFHYNRAIEYAKERKDIDQQVDVSLKMAWLYAKLHLPEKAYLLARKAENSCTDQKTAHQIPHISNYLRRIGDCYISSGKRPEGNACFQRALKTGLFSDTLEKIYNYNNWGVNLMNLNREEEAIRIFEKGIALAQRNKIEVWVGIMKGNQGWIYSNRGQLEHANTLVMHDLKASETYGDFDNASRAAQLLGKIAILQKNAPKAYYFLGYAKKLSPPIQYETSYVRLWSGYYALTQQWEQAYSYSKQAEVLLDSAIALKNNKERHRLDNLIDFLEEESEAQLQVEQAVFGQRQEQDRSILVLIVFVLVLGTGLLAFWQTNRRNHKKEQAFNHKLQDSRQELNKLRKQLHEKNQQLEHLKTMLAQKTPDLNQAPNPPTVEAILTQFTILTENDWRNFKHLFDEVHDSFIDKLSTHQANFTPAETRLLALLKLGLSSSEIAQSLGISLNGVKKGRQRLRKKLADWPEEKALLELLP